VISRKIGSYRSILAIASIFISLGIVAGTAQPTLRNCKEVAQCAQIMAERVEAYEDILARLNSRIDELQKSLSKANEALANLQKSPPAATATSVVAAPEAKRGTWAASKTNRGNSVQVAEEKIIEYCSEEGCLLRLGMKDYDGTGRVQSFLFLFYYNKDAKTWKASPNNWQGSNGDNRPEWAAQVGSCYFGDGQFQNYVGTDTNSNFGLVSWNNGNADCILTIEK
jgi:hypothetical protein